MTPAATETKPGVVSNWARKEYVHRSLQNWGRYMRNGIPGDIPSDRPKPSHINALMTAVYRSFCKNSGEMHIPPEIDEERAKLTHAALLRMAANDYPGVWCLIFIYGHGKTIRGIAKYNEISYHAALQRVHRAKLKFYDYMAGT